jgi:hypothetical protein
VSIPHNRIDWKAYDAFEAADAAFAHSIGLSPTNFAQYKRRRLRNERRVGDVPADRDIDLATDMAEAVDAYARQHRLEKREVLDLALRTFFAQVGEGVRGDA